MTETNRVPESKYLKPLLCRRKADTLQMLAVVFLVIYYVVPQYFGLPVPFFDLTALRMVLLAAVGIFLFDTRRRDDFFRFVVRVPFWFPMLLYMLVSLYTMVFRVDIKAFLNPVLEFIAFYLLVYFIHSVLGVTKTLRYILLFWYILGFLGVLEYVMGRSPFTYLETIKDLFPGVVYRSGSYRITGPALVSLGYGLMLITGVPFAALDIERNEINLFKRPLLLVLLFTNVLLTGSRSTLGIFFLEVVLLFLFSTTEGKKKALLLGGGVIVLLAVFVAAMPGSPAAKTIMMQVASVIDVVLDTNYAAQYGADVAWLEDSESYREQLVNIFGLDWLNPLLGLGRSREFSVEINGVYIYSVDSFYIAEFIRTAWPGLITYVLFILCYLLSMLRAVIQKRTGIYVALFVGACCYFINLLWLDTIQTLKYVYLLFAIFAALQLQEAEHSQNEEKETESKYLRKPLQRRYRGSR